MRTQHHKKFDGPPKAGGLKSKCRKHRWRLLQFSLVPLLLLLLRQPFIRPIMDEASCQCQASLEQPIHYDFILAISRHPRPAIPHHIVQGLGPTHPRCCVVPEACAPHANGILSGGDNQAPTWFRYYAHRLWGVPDDYGPLSRWMGRPDQVWAISATEMPESAHRFYRYQHVLDSYQIHYLATPMADADYPTNEHLFHPALYSKLAEDHCPLEQQPRLDQVLFLASNCRTGSDRDSFVLRFMQALPGRVDAVGNCLHNTEFPEDLVHTNVDPETGLSLRDTWGDFGKGLRAITCRYKFQIIVANCLCDDYLDEKLRIALDGRTVPLYLGMPNVDLFDPGLNVGVHRAFISVMDFESFTELAAHLSMLMEDEDEYNKYFEYRSVPPFSEGKGPMWVSKAHHTSFQKQFKHLLPYYNKSDTLGGTEAWLCDRVHAHVVDREPLPRATASTGRCFGTWREFMRKRGKNGYLL